MTFLLLQLLPEYMQELGYKTHFIGKWHLGFCNIKMHPMRRGFHSFYGMYNGKADYFNHTSKRSGYDMTNNLTVDWSADGVYATHLFTDK